MEGETRDGGLEKEEEAAERAELLRDRFRLSVISVANGEEQLRRREQLAKDVELFAQHAGRKSVNMEDVILSAHRNDHLAGLLRSFSQELKGKEPQTERKRKKSSKSDDKARGS